MQTYEIVIPWGDGFRAVGPVVALGDGVYSRHRDCPGHIQTFPEDLAFPIAGARPRYTDTAYREGKTVVAFRPREIGKRE